MVVVIIYAHKNRNYLTVVINSESSLTTSLRVVRASVWPRWEPSFRQQSERPRKTAEKDWPGVSWAGVQGLIMESVSHKQNSVNSDSGSNASKEFWEKLGDLRDQHSPSLLFALLLVIPSIWSHPLLPLSWTGNVVWGRWEGRGLEPTLVVLRRMGLEFFGLCLKYHPILCLFVNNSP